MHDQDDKHANQNQATAEEQALSELYASLSEEQPPESMDEKILVRAHEMLAAEVVAEHASFKRKEKRKSTGSPFSGHWVVPASLAAVVVLSVILITVIEEQRPYSLTSLPESGTQQSREPVTTDARRDNQVQSDSLEAQATHSSAMTKLAEKPVSPQLEQDAAKQANLARQNQTMAKRESNAAMTDRMAPPASLSDKSIQPPQQTQTLTRSTQQITSPEGVVLTKPRAVAKSSPQVSPAEVAAPKVAANTVSPAAVTKPPEAGPQKSDKESSNKSQPALAVSPTGKQSNVAVSDDKVPQATVIAKAKQETKKGTLQAAVGNSAAPAVAGGNLASQQKSKPEQGADTARQGDKPSEAAASEATAAESRPALIMPSETKIPKACYLLSINDCMAATECTLHWNGDRKVYQCQKDANACEAKFAQASGTAQTCNAKPGCKYVPAKCFCPPDTKCDCAAGPAAMCEPTK